MVNRPGQPMPQYYPVDASTRREFQSYTGSLVSADLRWNTPLKGLLVGASFLHEGLTAHGKYVATQVAYTLVDKKDHTLGDYGDYTRGNPHFSGEYRRQIRQWFN